MNQLRKLSSNNAKSKPPGNKPKPPPGGNNNNGNGNNGNGDDNDGAPLVVAKVIGGGDPDGLGGSGISLKPVTLPIIGTKQTTTKIGQWKISDHHPVMPLIIGSGKPHFMPYSFLYTITDKTLIDLLKYKVKMKQPFVGIFLRRHDL